MTTPKEALEQLRDYLRPKAKYKDGANYYMENEESRLLRTVNKALASLEGDAVERVARIINPDAFCSNPDPDEPEFWRKAAQHLAREKARAIPATGLVAGEAAIRGDWHTTGWDRARNSDRILLVWREFAGVREHVELGRYSDSKTAWVNTYGHPFHGEPDGWAPLLPFKTAETIKADEREKCAKIAESECYATTGRQIAAAIRSGGTNER